jgi:rare lipoprotein A
MRLLLCLMWMAAGTLLARAADEGLASWYGEELRGRPMANGKPFDPDQLTAASWFHPLGTRVRVWLVESEGATFVDVTITDRGPARRLVQQGRIIDLGRAAFAKLAYPDRGLVRVRVEQLSE